jgi:energy-coupling factor transporter ATP-binding protein EcfA2
MLKRIYIHNFRCFVNFEAHIDKINLLLGANGSGKTSVFDVLNMLQRFISNGEKVSDLFKSKELTRWFSDQPIQQFELDISGNGGMYHYHLEIEHRLDRQLVRVKRESLFFDQQPLYEFEIETDERGMGVGTGHLYNDNPNHLGVDLSLDWTRSEISRIQERHDNKKLSWFKNYLDRIFIVNINPRAMLAENRTSRIRPASDMSDYADWFDYLADENRREINQLENELKRVIKGFELFQFKKSGDAKILKLEFTNNMLFRLDELSDGQRVMIALYTLLYCLPDECLLCIDEPENFLALPEIQPWLDSLYDRHEQTPLQAILISHHPRIINYLANNAGFWFSRPENNHVRIQKISDDEDAGLSIARLIELGWIYDE